MKNVLIYALVAAWFAAVGAVVTIFGLMQEPSISPKQPIEFPHHIHIGQVGMECMDCHLYPEESIYAGLPDAALCMECHEAAAEDKPEIIKLTKFYESGEPVEWERVYRVKPHVYFTHKRHVRSGVKCQECHGAVELMTTAQRVTDLGMGWCLDCHNSRGAPRECIVCHK